MEGLRNMEASQTDALARDCIAYSELLNGIFGGYREELAAYLPLTVENLFERLKDGVLLAFLLKHYHPECIDLASIVRNLDLSQMDRPYSKVTYEVNANLNKVVAAAKSIKNIVVVNFGGEDILEGRRDLILGLLWQIVKTKVESRISFVARPELMKLVRGEETLTAMASLKSDAILTRWVNYHLEKSGTPRRVSNLGKDLADSEVYAGLMRQIAPKSVTDEDVSKVLAIDCGSEEGRVERAKSIIEIAEGLGCKDFISPQVIAQGNPRLNFAFTATLFDKHIGLGMPSEEELDRMQAQIDALKEEAERTAEEARNAQAAACATEERLCGEIAQLTGELSMARLSHAHALQETTGRFQRDKDELARQYSESLQAALEGERRSHQDAMWELLNKHKEARRQLIGLASLMRAEISQEVLERHKIAGAPSEDTEMDALIRTSGDMASVLIRQLHSMRSATDALKSTVAHKEKVNEVMGDKIREYTELVISGKKSDNRRGSLLRRIFANEQ